MTSIEFPSTIPYEDDKFKWDYDDKGVICRQDKETDGWEVMEPYCVECGHRDDECVCDNFYGREADSDEVSQEWKDWYDALPEAGKKIVKERLAEQLAEKATPDPPAAGPSSA